MSHGGFNAGGGIRISPSNNGDIWESNMLEIIFHDWKTISPYLRYLGIFIYIYGEISLNIWKWKSMKLTYNGSLNEIINKLHGGFSSKPCLITTEY
jgi:hypothetical protein